MNYLQNKRSLALAIFVIGCSFNVSSKVNGEEVTHSFLACGQKTYIMGADAKATWTYPQSTRDGFVLDNGNVILTLSKSNAYPGGAGGEVTPNGEEKLIWKGTQSEVNSAQPTEAGTFVITELAMNLVC